MIEISSIQVNLDFMLKTDEDKPVVLSFFDRSAQLIRSIGASLNNRNVTIKKNSYPRGTYKIYGNKGFDVYISPVTYGKEKFYHAIAISKGINAEFILSTQEKMCEHFYHFLMKNYDLPLLKEWSSALISRGTYEKQVAISKKPLIWGQHSVSDSFPIGKEHLKLHDISVISCNMSPENLNDNVSFLLKNRVIKISERPQKDLTFTDMDSYFAQYGHTLVENLERQIEPLCELNGNIENMCLRNMRLYPQQAAQVNAVVKRLNRASYCILNNGMGTGKTIEGASICEAYHIDKWLRKHPGKSLKDAYSNPSNIHYRACVLCPSHLVDKWQSEIEREIPFAKVTVLKDIYQVVDIKRAGIKRNGKEFFIISKDFSKLSYQLKPLPKIRRSGSVMAKVCADCGEKIYTTATSCKCGCKKLNLVDTGLKGTAMLCPLCKNLLVAYETNVFKEEDNKLLDHIDFATHSTRNSTCYYCGEPLWAPYVPNIGENKHNAWYRATHYRNKSHKGTKTVWVHKEFDNEYFQQIGEVPLNVIDSETYFGVRKVAPAYFIKKQLKGFFDFAIFDEAHLYKGAGTAQGNAMHAIIKASKKQIALTGTIAGGYASHLFYLLYRLDPGRMQKAGYRWNGVTSFIERYGQTETKFECSMGADEEYNVSSRGKQIGSPQEKPGISPRIFTDFLLDSTVFLDLSDMSKYLPPLKEYVEIIDVEKTVDDMSGNLIENPEASVLMHYNDILELLKNMSKSKGGRSLSSTMLQFSLSYLDHPYGADKIRHPVSGDEIVIPQNFYEFQGDKLLAKEKRLVELINKEQAEGRNCFVFAEYTSSSSTCVSYRLKSIIEKHCNLSGKVTVLESDSPAACEREKWMHKKAAEGTKVFITNPRCVETGLDFCFKKDGVLYNYPTLLFYQMGCSLFTIWQASRRHYRLNQREECRTYYMAVGKTVQQTIISLIAQKMAATSAIQGKFSIEGLSSMAQGIDVKLKLAESLSRMDMQSGANLQEMFDVLQTDNEPDNDMYGQFRRMLTLSELIGDDLVKELLPVSHSVEDTFFDIFNMFDMFEENESKVDTKTAEESFIIMPTQIKEPVSFKFDDTDCTKKTLKKVPCGQVNLFALYN